MNLTEPGEECEKGTPYADEESDNKDEGLPVLELGAPQEGPVLSVGLGKGELKTKDANDRIILTLLNQKSRSTNEQRDHNTSLRRKSVL